MSPLLAALLLVAPAAVRAKASPEAPASPRIRVEQLRLRASGVDVAALRAALALQVPHANVVFHDSDDGPDAVASRVFVGLQPAPAGGAWTLTLVASDGRAYDRTIEADPSSSPDDVVRLLAGNIGNLVSAIEAGTTDSDRRDVAIPTPQATEPAAACPVCPPVPPPVEPVVRPPVTPPKPAPPLLEIGVAVMPSLAIGLGPPTGADRMVGAGGELGAWFRLRSGVLLGAESRVLARRMTFDPVVVRARFAAFAGYSWRRGSFELATSAAFTVEPWVVRAGGASGDLADLDGATRRRRPLLGGALRVVPGHRFEWGRVALRIGPKLELAASSAIGDRGRVAELLVDDRGRPVTVGRLGGWELALGFDAVLWIPVRRGR